MTKAKDLSRNIKIVKPYVFEKSIKKILPREVYISHLYVEHAQ